MSKTYYVYMMNDKPHGTLYTGMTNDLIRRVWEHKEGLIDGFTKKYSLKRLIWFEANEDVEQAILREKRIKDWKRQWKINMI